MSSSPSLDSSESLESSSDSSESLEPSTISDGSFDSNAFSNASLESSSDSMDDAVENTSRIIAPTQETKMRKTVTHEIVSMVVRQIRRKEQPSIKIVSEDVGLGCSAVHKLLRELREGKHDYGDFVVYRPAKKVRNRSSPKSCPDGRVTS